MIYVIISLKLFWRGYAAFQDSLGSQTCPPTKRKDPFMITITVCIGSSCHIKGSRQVVAQLQSLISEHKLNDRVVLGGTFCMGNCQKGVCVTVNDSLHSVTPESVEEFFKTEILEKM